MNEIIYDKTNSTSSDIINIFFFQCTQRKCFHCKWNFSGKVSSHWVLFPFKECQWRRDDVATLESFSSHLHTQFCLTLCIKRYFDSFSSESIIFCNKNNHLNYSCFIKWCQFLHHYNLPLLMDPFWDGQVQKYYSLCLTFCSLYFKIFQI